jgi:tetratricopeptide (TPR) repeat protein
MHWKETVGWIEQIAAARGADAAPNAIRARSLYCASMLAYNFDLPAARRLSEECLEMSRAIGFGEGMAWALLWLGYIDTRKRDESTRELFEESLRLGRQVEDRWYASMVVVQCLICYAGYEALMGRAETAESLAHDCEREVSGIGGDRLYVGHCRALLGNMAVRRGDFERAGELLNQALAIYREVESKFDIGGALAQLGFLALRQGHSDQALQLFRQSLALHRNYPMSQWVAKGLAHLVIALAACRRSRVAAQLAGLLSGSGGDAGTPPELAGQVAREYGAAVVSVRDALGEPAFAEAWNAGCSMSREQGIELALAD